MFEHQSRQPVYAAPREVARIELNVHTQHTRSAVHTNMVVQWIMKPVVGACSRDVYSVTDILVEAVSEESQAASAEIPLETPPADHTVTA